MKQSKYRKELNNVLINWVERAQPLFERIEEECSGSQNDFLKERAQKYMEKIKDARRQAIEAAETAYKGYLQRLDKKAKSITGQDIDKADIVLLESNLYTLNQEEFDVLQDKYEGNRVMERLLAGYAEKKGSPIDEKENHRDVKKILVCRFMSDKEKKALAAQLYNECLGWIQNDNGYSVADYVLNMAGDMFGAADKLKE